MTIINKFLKVEMNFITLIIMNDYELIIMILLNKFDSYIPF